MPTHPPIFGLFFLHPQQPPPPPPVVQPPPPVAAAAEAGEKAKLMPKLDSRRRHRGTSFDYCGTFSDTSLRRRLFEDHRLGRLPRRVRPQLRRRRPALDVRLAAASRRPPALIWRANHKSLGAWAERAYPKGHLIDNSDGAAAA